MSAVVAADPGPIVEDEVGIASLYETWLTETYSVEVAHDCATAYEILDEAVDVALLDRQLPDGSGDELVTHIRETGYDCRVVMVSAVEPAFGDTLEGFDEYLCKPTTKEELRETVERLSNRADGGESESLPTIRP